MTDQALIAQLLGALKLPEARVHEDDEDAHVECYTNGWNSCLHAVRQAIAAAEAREVLPPGWRHEEVPSAEFDDLMFWLDRCDEKGHLDNCPDLIEPMAAFNRARCNRALLAKGDV